MTELYRRSPVYSWSQAAWIEEEREREKERENERENERVCGCGCCLKTIVIEISI